MSRKISASEYMGYDKYIGDEYIVKKNPNMIEIPDNATNGDVIKAVFPNIEIIINTETQEVTVDDSVNTYMHFFDLDWWNAPYKREGEQK